MGKSKSAGNGKLIIGILATLVVVFGALLYLNSGKDLSQGNTYPLDNNNNNAQDTNAAYITDNSGTLSLSVQNIMNTTAKGYLAATVRVYKKETPNSLFGTVTTIATGTGRGTLTIDKFTADAKPQEYIYVVPAVDGSMTSTSGTFIAAENVEVNAKVAQQAGLLFKVYDNEARGYAQETTELSAAGATFATGKTWFSTTSNSTGLAVGQGGYFDYTVYLSQNGTASTTTQFEDQQLLIAIDAQDLSDWQKPTITIPGAVVTELTPGSGLYSDKIKNEGYDWVYQVTKDGKPYHIDSTFTKMNVQQYAKAGVNPSDDIKIGLYTSGYFTHTLNDGVSVSTHKDDSSQTAVFTVQDLTLSIS